MDVYLLQPSHADCQFGTCGHTGVLFYNIMRYFLKCFGGGHFCIYESWVFVEMTKFAAARTGFQLVQKLIHFHLTHQFRRVQAKTLPRSRILVFESLNLRQPWLSHTKSTAISILLGIWDGKWKNLYHFALRIDTVRPHSQVAAVLAPGI